MKKYIFIGSTCLALAAFVFLSCEKKKDDNRITPTYKEEANGTAGNPQPGNVTVTGTVSTANPASENSSLLVGGSGWSNPTCASTNSLTLRGINGSIDVTINFLIPPAAGTTTYNVAGSPGPGVCSMVVQNAPNQPAGIVWYGKSGVVSVQTTTSSINASFQSVACVQQSFNFPMVSVSGNIGCN
ncbi:MAG: hypothetical protein K0S32_3952 [Bacteroidetes bacterium]|jgi:hypothetical protein|nr:hypothetical protein [Bacteroidota bacterium]